MGRQPAKKTLTPFLVKFDGKDPARNTKLGRRSFAPPTDGGLKSMSVSRFCRH